MTGLVFQGDLATLRVVLDLLDPAGTPGEPPPEWFFGDQLPDADERDRRDDLDRRVAGITDKAFGPVGLQAEAVRFCAGSVTAHVHINTGGKAVTLDPVMLFAALNQSIEDVKGPIRDYTDAFMNRDARGPTRVEINGARIELGAGALQPTDPTVPPAATPDQLTGALCAAVLVVLFAVCIPILVSWGDRQQVDFFAAVAVGVGLIVAVTALVMLVRRGATA